MSVDIHTESRKGTLSLSKLDEFLQGGGRLNEVDPKTHYTPLAGAAKAGNISTVELLLQRNADVNEGGELGRFPLWAAATARNRVEIVRLLVDKGAKLDAKCDGETPIMAAIRAGDPKVVALLYKAGADLNAIGSNGESVRDMIQKSNDPEMQRAIRPVGQLRAGFADVIQAVINLVLFILAYVNNGFIGTVARGVVAKLYNIAGSTEPDEQLAKALNNPTTAEDFVNSMNIYVEESGLGKIFSPDNDFLQKVAEKAVHLKDDQNNYLKKPEHVNDLTKLALYQTVFYCDDSGSMNERLGDSGETRMDAQRSLVKRMASIATRLKPDGHNAHLCFINKPGKMDNLNESQINDSMNFVPAGGTKIGTQLREKILKPYIYDVLDGNSKLQMPYLILTITDGEPYPEDPATFSKSIIECGKRLDESDYPQESVMFLVSQVGDDQKADKFLDSLSGSGSSIDRVVYRTSERLDQKYDALRNNDTDLEEWLLGVLLQPLTS